MHLWRVEVSVGDKTYYYVLAKTAREAIDRIIALQRNALPFTDEHIFSCDRLDGYMVL
jgi:hypothetical protein